MTPDTHTALPHAAAQKGLTEWHRIVAESDWDALPELLVDGVVFHNPAAFEPHHGKSAMAGTLPAVYRVLQDFTYLRHYGRETGYVLEFSARVRSVALAEPPSGRGDFSRDHDGVYLVCSGRLPLPARGDRGRGALVPALRPVLPRRRGVARRTPRRGRPRDGLPVGPDLHGGVHRRSPAGPACRRRSLVRR